MAAEIWDFPNALPLSATMPAVAKEPLMWAQLSLNVLSGSFAVITIASKH